VGTTSRWCVPPKISFVKIIPKKHFMQQKPSLWNNTNPSTQIEYLKVKKQKHFQVARYRFLLNITKLLGLPRSLIH